MSEGENSVGGISDISNLSDDEELNLGTLKAPPSRGNLEKETGRLRLKYKILREALVEEKLTKVDQEIEDIETGRNPAVQEELDALETRRKERTTMAYERKRVQVDAIVSDYKAKVQAFQDEQAVNFACDQVLMFRL
jgi:thioesterase domain-containing protein